MTSGAGSVSGRNHLKSLSSSLGIRLPLPPSAIASTVRALWMRPMALDSPTGGYLDFELSIWARGNRYYARVTDSPAGPSE
jgi:hypothetical protein